MRKFLYILCALFVIGWGVNTSAFEPRTNQRRRSTAQRTSQKNICSSIPTAVSIEIMEPQTKYITHLSAKEIARKNSISECNVMDNDLFCLQGLTVTPKFSVIVSLEARTTQINKQVFACPKKLKLLVKFKAPIMVYITNEVKPNSCQYNTIYDHENYHVAVFKQSVDFFKPQIKQFFENEMKKLEPAQIITQNDMSRAAQNFSETLLKNFLPIQEHINKKIQEKNDAIDTPESYREQSRRCQKGNRK